MIGPAAIAVLGCVLLVVAGIEIAFPAHSSGATIFALGSSFLIAADSAMTCRDIRPHVRRWDGCRGGSRTDARFVVHQVVGHAAGFRFAPGLHQMLDPFLLQLGAVFCISVLRIVAGDRCRAIRRKPLPASLSQ